MRGVMRFPSSIDFDTISEDPDVEFRRNVALALGVLSGGWWSFGNERRKVDISAALPALIAALNDADSLVRAWAAQDIGNIGPNAAVAVPALITLLSSGDEAARNSACIALRGIGPAAASALPALRAALSDPSGDLRLFADRAIKSIEGEPW
jgi:HEAT repeat protein